MILTAIGFNELIECHHIRVLYLSVYQLRWHSLSRNIHRALLPTSYQQCQENIFETIHIGGVCRLCFLLLVMQRNLLFQFQYAWSCQLYLSVYQSLPLYLFFIFDLLDFRIIRLALMI